MKDLLSHQAGHTIFLSYLQIKVVSGANIVLINHPQNLMIITSKSVLVHIQELKCNKHGQHSAEFC